MAGIIRTGFKVRAAFLFFVISFLFFSSTDLAYAHTDTVSSGFQNLLSTICQISGFFFTVNGFFKFKKFLRMDKSEKIYKRTRIKAFLYPAIGILLLALLFFQKILQNPTSFGQLSLLVCCSPESRKDRSGWPRYCNYVSPPKRVELGWVEREWEEKSRNGAAEAQLKLGDYYYNESQTQADDVFAARWWEKAAELGNEKAQWKIAITPDLDFGDSKEKWLRKFARQGNFSAQRLLARHTQDMVESCFWYKVAALHPQCLENANSSDCKEVEEQGRQVYQKITAKQMLDVLKRVKERKPESPAVPEKGGEQP